MVAPAAHVAAGGLRLNRNERLFVALLGVSSLAIGSAFLPPPRPQSHVRAQSAGALWVTAPPSAQSRGFDVVPQVPRNDTGPRPRWALINGESGATTLIDSDTSLPTVVNLRARPPETLRVEPSPPQLLEAGEDHSFPSKEAAEVRGSFVEMFRGSAPYIRMHRGASMVVHIPGEVLESACFQNLMDDVALLSLLGVHVVLVVGSRPQVDGRLDALGIQRAFCGEARVTDARTLRVCKEAAGYVRFEVESALSRGSRRANPVNVAGGNFFSAQPVGVRGGVDFGYTGEVRRIEADKIRARLAQGDVVQLTCIGFSGSGEVFNVDTEALASECASQLGASKLIYVTEGQQLVDTVTGAPVQNLRLSEAKTLLEFHEVHKHGTAPSARPVTAAAATAAGATPIEAALASARFVTEPAQQQQQQQPLPPPPPPPQQQQLWQQQQMPSDFAAASQGLAAAAAAPAMAAGAAASHPPLRVLTRPASRLEPGNCTAGFMGLVAHSVRALSKGVPRAHLVSPLNGALVQELFTRDGSGLLVSRDIYDGIRPATASDLPGIMDIITPLVQEGILVERSRDQLEKEIGNFFVYTRDGTCLACASIKRYGSEHAEVACLAVAPGYRKGGRGEALLGYLERVALASGVNKVFVLSTRTMQWFVERGFKEVPVEALPESRRACYNWERRSKVYLKELRSTREIDAEELFWDIGGGQSPSSP